MMLPGPFGPKHIPDPANDSDDPPVELKQTVSRFFIGPAIQPKGIPWPTRDLTVRIPTLPFLTSQPSTKAEHIFSIISSSIVIGTAYSVHVSETFLQVILLKLSDLFTRTASGP